MRPTAELTSEHNQIKIMLAVIDAACDRLDAGQALPAEHLEKMVAFVVGFIDKRHHDKEEGLLFPAMESAGAPVEGGPLAVMSGEHDIARQLLKQMSDAASAYKAGEAGAAAAFVESGRDYVSLMLAHIDKEDQFLYPMADRQLSGQQQEKLRRMFDKTNAATEDCERLLDDMRGLQEIYIKGIRGAHY